MIKDITDSQFGRRDNHAPAKMKIQLIVASGQTVQTATRTIEGAIRAISVGVNDNDGNKTAIVSIIDNDGADAIFTAQQSDALEGADDDKAKIFKKAATMKNEYGRNAYLNDQGLNPDQFAAWQNKNSR